MNGIITKSENETNDWASDFIKKINNKIICLNGKIGAGKSVIVRGFAKGLNIKDPITSPTFTLINEYKGDCNFYHFDLYRLDNLNELYDLGFEEYLNKPGIKVFEWAEKFNVFPKDIINININIINYNERKIIINGK